MRLEVKHNAREVNRFVRFVFDRQVPFATARAINDAALASQRVQREHHLRVFTVRSENWLRLAPKIKPFASKRSPEARIQIDPPGPRDSALIQHEADPRKHPISGRSIAVPTRHVRRTPTGRIVAADRPSAIKERGRRGRGTTSRGRFGGGTFVGRLRTGHPAIWERVRDTDGLRPLYWLVSSVDLDQRLQFFENVHRTVLKTFPDAFTRRFDQAIRTAR